MFEEIKAKQRDLIESVSPIQSWIKDEIINVLDIQFSQLPVLDQDQYTILINSAEHPNGYKPTITAHPTLRIRNGKIVRGAKTNKPDTFFWEHETYLKFKSRSKYYLIGNDCGEHLENYVQLRNRILNEEDGKQLSFKVASRKNSLEVIETPAEQRYGIEVTEELLKVLPALLESYNNKDATAMVPLAVGDLLVRDGPAGSFYYRVEKSLKEQTYSGGEISLL